MTGINEMARRAHLPPPERQPGSDSAVHERSPLIGQLMAQTWAEMEEARDRYNQDAKRFRRWRWWFVGMFTFYTTLVGILLLKLLTGL